MQHPRRTALLFPVLATLLTLPLHASSFDPGAAEDEGAYALGTRAMNEHRWADAVTSFDHVARARGKKADAALYWKAYSLNKLGNGPLAISTCVQLHSQYSSSRWNNDCSALTIDLRSDVHIHMPAMPSMPPLGPMNSNFDFDTSGSGGQRGSDADLKILAMNSLLNRDPAQAIPIIRGILSGNQPEDIKKHALFVLAQSKSPEAGSILHDAVMGKMGKGLQLQAIQSSSIFQGKSGNDGLAEVYRATSDPQIKRAIISAFFISQDAPRMVELARNEKDLELKRSIVSQLALMQDKAATDYMLELLK